MTAALICLMAAMASVFMLLVSFASNGALPYWVSLSPIMAIYGAFLILLAWEGLKDIFRKK